MCLLNGITGLNRQSIATGIHIYREKTTVRSSFVQGMVFKCFSVWFAYVCPPRSTYTAQTSVQLGSVYAHTLANPSRVSVMVRRSWLVEPAAAKCVFKGWAVSFQKLSTYNTIIFVLSWVFFCRAKTIANSARPMECVPFAPCP